MCVITPDVKPMNKQQKRTKVTKKETGNQETYMQTTKLQDAASMLEESVSFRLKKDLETVCLHNK